LELNKKIEILNANILDQAKFYLEDADEFYPFGCLLFEDNTLKPISIFWGDDYPDPTDVLIKLEEELTKKVKAGKNLIAAIGIDVFINVIDEKKSALEIRILDKDSIIKYYFLYFKEDDIYRFENYTL
jgi:hypothetical protein